MARDLFSNQGSTTVSSGGTTAPSQGTTESWTVASSSTFPAASNAASPATQFYISDPALPAETILVTNVSGTTWSVTRGADGTTPVAHTAGFTVRNVVTAAWLTATQDASKNRRFDVIEFGADNTGVADSTTAFQACAAAVQAYISTTKRATMLIPQGKYTLSDTFTIVGGNVTIDARGAYLKMTASKDFFRDYTTQDTTFTLNGKGLRVLGGVWDLDGHNRAQGVAAGNAGYSGFTVACSSDILFHGLTIRNVKAYHGIDINTADGVVVDSCRFEGFKNSHEWKTAVVAASTGNVAVASALVNGLVMDTSVTLATGQRVLLRNQTAPAENGIWIVAASGAASRATDLDGGTEANDAAVNVTGGTTQAGMNYVQTVGSVTIGTTGQTWSTNWHLQCKLATTGNISLTGAQSVDGTAVVTADRILVRAQTLSKDNGIYAANTAGAWTRVADMNSGASVTNAEVHVTNGTTYAGKDFVQSLTVTTIGTDAQTWSNDFVVNRYFSEACQIDEGDNNTPSKNVKVVNCYMGPAIDGSGLLSFGKMAGSHTDSPSIVYQNIQLIGNTSVASLSNAFQGDSWADAVITGNIVLGSSERGIRCLFNSSNTGPRITISNNTISNTVSHGIEVDGSSGTFADVNVSGNTITNTAMVGATCGIRVDTCNRLTVSANEIQNNGTGNQAIMVTGVTGGNVSGNGCYNAGTVAIQIAASSSVLCTGNTIVTPNDGGIWVTGVSSKVTVANNLIVGANNTITTNANGSLVVSSTANDNISFIGNRIQKGAGSNSTTPFTIQGTTSPSNIEFLDNSVGSEWGYGYGNYTIGAGNTSVFMRGLDGTNTKRLAADVTGLTSTTLADITGLSSTLPVAGKYKFKVYGHHQNASLVGIGFGITGPTTTLSSYTYNVQTGVSGGATNVVHSSNVNQNTSKSGNVAIINTTYGFSMDGWIEVSASGTLQIQYILSAAGTAKILTGTTLVVERVA